MPRCSKKKCSKGSRKGRDGRCHKKKSRSRSGSRQRCSPGFLRSQQSPYGCLPHEMKPLSGLVPCAYDQIRKLSSPRRCVKRRQSPIGSFADSLRQMRGGDLANMAKRLRHVNAPEIKTHFGDEIQPMSSCNVIKDQTACSTDEKCSWKTMDGRSFCDLKTRR